MKIKKISLLATIALSVMMTAMAVEKQPAFPGAEGYGRYTTGGRGGAVYYVTSLADDGSVGTLRWALNQSGKRTIMFKVSGTIFLTKALSVSKGDVTIAGQTAPGDGICVADYPFTIQANNVIVRYMRFRLGSRQVSEHEGDGLGAMDHENIIIDHCSVSWSIDECLSVLGNKNTTVQWCIASHSLVDAGHSKGAHGYGGNWGGNHASFHHNLMIHHVSRMPRLGPRQSTQTEEHMDMRNNVFYNWAGNGCYGGEGMDVNIVNNYYKPGPGTPSNKAVAYRIAAVGIRTTAYCQNNDGSWNGWYPMWHKWGHLYVNGNVNPSYSSVTNDNWTYGIYNQIDASGNDGTYTAKTKDTIRLSEPLDFIYTTTHTAEMAYSKVLDYVGCSLKRDSYDEELVSDARNGKASHQGDGLSAGFINTQDDLKPSNADATWSPWPTLNSSTAPSDTDGDGIPDAWESTHGLDSSNAADGAEVCSDGYTNLEHYLNSLVENITVAQNAGGTVMGDMKTVDYNLPEKLEISAQTSKGDGDFQDGDYTIVSGDKKLTATTGSYYMKMSRNVDYKFTLPEGVSVKSIKFEGYMNGDSGTGYVSKVGNKVLEEAPNDYVLRNRKETGAGEDNYTFDFSPSLSGTITLAVTGDAQSAIRVTLYVDQNPDAISSVSADEKYDNGYLYGIDGRMIMKQETYGRLPKGMYIIGGKKVVK